MEGSDAVEWILEVKIETNVKSRNYDQLETVRKIAKKRTYHRIPPFCEDRQ